MKLPIRYCAFVALVLVSAGSSLRAATTVVLDEFDAGTQLTGATVLPGTNWAGGVGVTEANGALTFSTITSQGRWSTRAMHTSVVSPDLNIFRNAVTISIRDFSLEGFGDHVAPNSRFRFGLMPRDNEAYSSGATQNGGNSLDQFYNNGNDGIVFNLQTTALGTSRFELMYKSNIASVSDPNILITGGNQTLNFLATHFDVTLSSTQWSVALWNDEGQRAEYQGSVPLADREATWGNAVDGWGNAGFLMGIQNMGLPANSEPIDTSNGYTLASIGSLSITSVPEPGRAMLATLALGVFGYRRRR